jgi:hypothetical protein
MLWVLEDVEYSLGRTLEKAAVSFAWSVAVFRRSGLLSHEPRVYDSISDAGDPEHLTRVAGEP